MSACFLLTKLVLSLAIGSNDLLSGHAKAVSLSSPQIDGQSGGQKGSFREGGAECVPLPLTGGVKIHGSCSYAPEGI